MESPKKKAIFIDGSNLYFMLTCLGIHSIDYSKFRNLLSALGGVHEILDQPVYVTMPGITDGKRKYIKSAGFKVDEVGDVKGGDDERLINLINTCDVSNVGQIVLVSCDKDMFDALRKKI